MAGRLSQIKMDSRFGRIGLPILAGVLAASGHAPLNWGFPTLLGLMASYFLFARACDAKSAFRTGWWIGVGYFAVSLNWIVEPFLIELAATGWMAPFALILMSGGLALFWGAAMWLAFRFGQGIVVWAVAMALGDFVRAYLLTGFPWATPSYTWVNSIAAQIAAWIGPHGLNFLLFLSAAWLARLTIHKSICSYKWPMFIFLVISAIPATKMEMPTDGPIFRLIQPNAPQDEKWRRDMLEVFFERQLSLSAEPGNPDFIVWPETAVALPIPHAADLFVEMAAIAGDAQIITGIQRVDGLLNYNSLVVLDTSGHVEQIYDKHHLVPFGEYLPLGDLLARYGLHGLAAEDGAGYASGHGPQNIALAGIGAVLPLICYEVVFPQDLRVESRPKLLLQITNDAWFGRFSGPYQHLAQARMRTIEQGLPMIRVANTGVSAVIDARGNIVASIPLGQSGYLDTNLPSEKPETLYAKTGDIPIAVVLLLLGFIAIAWKKRIPIDGSRRQN